MVAINFKMFPDKVAAGTKNQTIRNAAHKSPGVPLRPGDDLQLYHGMRTKACKLLREAVCKSVTQVILMEHTALLWKGLALTGIGLEEFAQADGFACYADMWAFFKGRANAAGEYHGWLIKW